MRHQSVKLDRKSSRNCFFFLDIHQFVFKIMFGLGTSFDCKSQCLVLNVFMNSHSLLVLEAWHVEHCQKKTISYNFLYYHVFTTLLLVPFLYLYVCRSVRM